MARVVELLGPGRRDVAAAHWCALEARAPATQLASSWAWTSTWLRHYGDAVDHRFALLRDEDGPVGAALLTRDVSRAGPLRIRRLHVGTAGEPPGSSVWVERNGLAALPGREGQVAAEVAAAAQRIDGWDALCLPGFVPGLAEHFWHAPLDWHIEREPCWVADLEHAEGGVVEQLGASTRANVRRGIRKLGRPQVHWAADAGEAIAMLDELSALSISRHSASAFRAPRFARFHRELVGELLPTGRAWLARISTERHLLAIAYGFREGDRMIGYQTARGPAIDAPVSPGTLADVALMDAARVRGVRLYDPLAGDSGGHKQRLATHRHDLVWARGRRGRLRWGMHDAGRTLRRRVRQQSPAA